MKSEFYWGFISSLIVAVAFATVPNFKMFRMIHREGGEFGPSLGFSLLPFVGIYFVVGVIMLFSKTSERFAKGLLLSALILFFLTITSGLMRI
jgi:hypothetical protein